MAQEYKIKDLQSLDLKPGEKKEIELEGLDSKVLLLNAGGKIQAVGPRCTHYGAPLVNGVLSTNGRLTCPWHGGEWLLPALCFAKLHSHGIQKADVGLLPTQPASTPRPVTWRTRPRSTPCPSFP